MKNRTAEAIWQGNLEQGDGNIQFGNGRFDEPYSADSRFEDGEGTNPEELIAAAHAGCYSMAFSHALAEAGYTVDRVETKATVHLDKNSAGISIASIDLHTRGNVSGIADEEFQNIAADAKVNCPVSKALAACEIRLVAELV